MREARTLRSVDWVDGSVAVIDQTALPGSIVIRRCEDTGSLVEAISALRVRGAPAIGIAGAFGIAASALRLADLAKDAHAMLDPLEIEADQIRRARPTAVNLAWAVDRVMTKVRNAVDSNPTPREVAEMALIEAFAIRAEDADSCLHMAKHAQGLIPRGARILTHCNTGFLCTGGIGTALGAIRMAHEDGLEVEVFATETRPLLQGARLTVWELSQLGIPHDLIVDGAAAGLIMAGEVDLVLVGADRIAANGDTANKVGTLAHALAAAAAGIPFVVVAPSSTIDPRTSSGASIAIEERSPLEVLGLVSPPGTGSARNPAFDVTPANLITAIVTQEGVHQAPYRF